MINKITLVGNLGKDPEVKHLDGDKAYAKFSVATTDNFKNKSGEWEKKTEWHNVIVWGHQAKFAEKYIRKGNRVYIEGKLTHRNYEDKDGVTKYITEIVGRELKSLEKKEDGGNSGASNLGEPQKAQAPAGKSQAVLDAEKTLEDAKAAAKDDLPF